MISLILILNFELSRIIWPIWTSLYFCCFCQTLDRIKVFYSELMKLLLNEKWKTISKGLTLLINKSTIWILPPVQICCEICGKVEKVAYLLKSFLLYIWFMFNLFLAQRVPNLYVDWRRYRVVNSLLCRDNPLCVLIIPRNMSTQRFSSRLELISRMLDIFETDLIQVPFNSKCPYSFTIYTKKVPDDYHSFTYEINPYSLFYITPSSPLG